MREYMNKFYIFINFICTAIHFILCAFCVGFWFGLLNIIIIYLNILKNLKNNYDISLSKKLIFKCIKIFILYLFYQNLTTLTSKSTFILQTA